MQAEKLGVERGWGWIADGWGLFTKNAAAWIIVGVIFLVAVFILNLVPFIGSLATALLAPVFVGGLMVAAQRSAQGDSVELKDMFAGFQDKEKLQPLLLLGVVAIVVSIIMFLIIMTLVGGAMTAMYMGGGGEAASPAMGFGMLFSMFLVLVLEILAAMLFFFATPLVALAGVAPFEAVKKSFSACLLNIVPYLFFGVIVIVLAFFAIIPLALGLIVLLPVVFCAEYCAYRDVFGASAASTPATGEALEGKSDEG